MLGSDRNRDLIPRDKVAVRWMPSLELQLLTFGLLTAAAALAALLPDGLPKNLAQMVFWVVVLGYGAATLAVAIRYRRLHQHLAMVVEATGRIKNGEEHFRLPVGEWHENKSLALSFNAMAERLELQTRELRLLADVVSGSFEPILVLDNDERIIYANPAFQGRLRFSQADLLGRPYSAVFSTDHSNILLSLWPEVRAGRTFSADIPTLTQGGGTFDSQISVHPVVEDGVVVRFIAVHRDMGRVRELEREKAAYNSNLLHIHEISRRMIAGGNTAETARRAAVGIARRFSAGCRIWISASFESPRNGLRLLSASGRVGGPSPSHLRPNEGCAGRAAETLKRVVCEGDTGTCRIDGQSGALPTNTHVAIPFFVNNTAIGVLEVVTPSSTRGRIAEVLQILAEILSAALSTAVLHDRLTDQTDDLARMTTQLESALEEQKHAHSQLALANERLVAADRAKSHFLAATSHELRTPLSSIIGFLQLILDGMASSREEEHEFVMEAQKCSRHLLSLINDVLDLARIEAGRLQISLGRVDALPLFRDVESVVGVQVDAKKLQLRFEADDAVAANADYTRTRQVLINLVGNAVKFTESGSIVVRARSLSDRGFVEFSVTDTGIGIDPDCQTKLFEAFVQAHGGISRRHGGSGLGLTISRNLVTLMGGVIQLRSAGLGHGTELSFLLPIWRVEPFQSPGQSATVSSDGPTVFLIDHDSSFRRSMSGVLVRNGFRVSVFADLDSALKVGLESPPDVLVAEYLFPLTANIRLRHASELHQLLGENSSPPPALIVVTGLPLDQPPIAALFTDPSVAAIVSKATPQEEILASINDVFQQSAAPSTSASLKPEE